MATRPTLIECPDGWEYDKATGECYDPWASPPIIVRQPPQDEVPVGCPDGYELVGYGGLNTPICQPIVVNPVDPVYPPTCLPGAVWDASRGLCVTQTDPIDIGPVYIDPGEPTDNPGTVSDPICPSGQTWNGQACVMPQTVTPGGTTPGILDGLLDANGKLFGFEPMYVGIAAVAVVLLMFSGGGKR